ncbi:MAG TPA: TerB family tellurite resistance protein [Steroidobacter sp.]|uniref:TerB family tellurite resistance protein n=1 Tax=Steroidobacter sp. TaxID=1978227 RepID=UPI002ED9BC33
MHIIIAAITAVAGLIWALNNLQRSGFDLNSLNPFLAYRRWKWRSTYGNKPIYKLERPMDVAAVLLLGVAKADGDITSDQKRELQSMFQSEFEISRDEAADLLLASSHLIRDEIYIVDRLDKILERSAPHFEPTAVASLLGMMRKLAAMDGSINGEQQKLIDATERFFASRKKGPNGKWS